MAILARNLGKQIEPGLWESWGEPPTTQLLRHAGTGNPVLRERWHKFLSKLLGKPLPTLEEEKADPDAADDIYNAGIKLLINKTRDVKTFHLLYKRMSSNADIVAIFFMMRLMGVDLYPPGFDRMFGGCGTWNTHVGDPKIYPWVCLAADLVFLAWWIFTIKSAWVKVPAFAYAERLLESIENVPQSKGTRSAIVDAPPPVKGREHL